MFQHISLGLSRLIDRLFTNLLKINFTETRTEGIQSSGDEEFRIFKLKLGKLKVTKTGRTSFSTRVDRALRIDMGR